MNKKIYDSWAPVLGFCYCYVYTYRTKAERDYHKSLLLKNKNAHKVDYRDGDKAYSVSWYVKKERSSSTS